MPRLAQSVPKYRKHKASRIEYDRLNGEWLTNGRATKPINLESGSLLVVELIAAYLNLSWLGVQVESEGLIL